MSSAVLHGFTEYHATGNLVEKTVCYMQMFYGFENFLSLVDTPQSRFKMSFTRGNVMSVCVSFWSCVQSRGGRCSELSFL